MRLDSNKVATYCKRRGTFTTDDVAKWFKVTRQHAAAPIAILRIKDWVRPADPHKTAEGVSRWDWVGQP